MKNVVFIICLCLIDCISWCQDGVLYVKSSKEISKKYPLVIMDTSNEELHFSLASNHRKEVGIFLSKYELGFWNSEIDTFSVNDSLLVVFINPFPDVVIKESVPNPSILGKIQNVGISGFIYVKSIDGKYISKCLQKTDKGTMMVYFFDDISITEIEYYLAGNVVNRQLFEPNTNFMYINN